MVPEHKEQNPILKYFTLRENSAKCNVCHVSLAFKSSSYVSGLVYHLKNRPGHQDVYEDYCRLKEVYKLQKINHYKIRFSCYDIQN